MRWAKKFFIRSDPYYGSLLSLVDDGTNNGLAYWISMPQTRPEFVQQVNDAITISSYSFVQIMAGLRLQIWNNDADFNNSPDFSGWGQFQKETNQRTQRRLDTFDAMKARIDAYLSVIERYREFVSTELEADQDDLDEIENPD